MPPREKNTGDEPDPTATESKGDTVRLAVSYPHDVLIVGDGDTRLKVTSDGTDVPAGREDEVKDAAKANGVTIRKVG